jgi:hypothetical protein
MVVEEKCNPKSTFYPLGSGLLRITRAVSKLRRCHVTSWSSNSCPSPLSRDCSSIRGWQPSIYINSKHYHHIVRMVSQSRASERTYTQRISEEGALITQSQPTLPSTSKRRQSKLPFSQPTPRELLPRDTPPTPPQRSPSQSAPQESSIQPSESISVVSRTKT